MNFDAALKKNNNSRTSTTTRACVNSIRDRWEKFWTYPEVGEALAKWTKRQAAIRAMGNSSANCSSTQKVKTGEERTTEEAEEAREAAVGRRRDQIVRSLAAGTAADEGGEQTVSDALEQIQKLWTALDLADRTKFVDWSRELCATCGRRGTWKGAPARGIYCDACCDEGEFRH